MSAPKRWLHIFVPLVILLGAAVLRYYEPAIIDQARLAVFDTYQRLQPRVFDPGLPVRIVDLDDESLARLGQWPWPRTILARLVDRLRQSGVAAIAFDIVFAEPDRTSPARILPLWPSTPALEALRAEAAEMLDHDRIFATAIAQMNVVVGFAMIEGLGGGVPEEKGTFAQAGDDPRSFIPGFASAVINLPDIEAAAMGNGSFNTYPDRDNITRRVPLVLRIGETLYPSIAAEALRVAQGAQSYIIKSSGASGIESYDAHTGISQIKIGGFVVPTDAQGRILLYATGHQPARFVPAWRVLEPDFDPNLVAGQIVLVGTSAAGLKDLRATPLDPVAPGVEIHAEIIEQIISGDYLLRPDMALGAELLYLVALGLVLVFLIPTLGARWCGVLGIGIVAGACAASWYAFDAWKWLLDPVYPSLAVLVVYLVETGIIFLRTETERRWVRNAFGRYLSPAVVNQLAEHPENLQLGGEMREMTLLFCDIRGFTTISEQFDAEGLTQFVNRFLTPMTDVILKAGGTIDKYMGDCIMAFWNAPVPAPDHALHSCRAALAMRKELERLNVQWRAEADTAGREHTPVRIGIGLNTGICCVGNVGSDQRFNYSVLGDDVNLASRLEGQLKTYGVDIVISDSTWSLAGEGLAALELDLIQVKSKTRPVRIFALLGENGAADGDAFHQLAARHTDMLGAYRGQDWDAAEAVISDCLGLADGRLEDLYGLYTERIPGYRVAPPGPDWDGVYVAETK